MKHIVVTGCTSGLGRALLTEFIAAGHRVTGCGRSANIIKELSEQYAEPMRFAALDISDDAAVQAWAADTIKAIGAPDVLINNAGVINDPASLESVPLPRFQEIMAINVTGVFSMIRHYLPAMRAAGHGVIINMSSEWGRSVAPEVAPYCASKWAIEGLTKALAEELPAGMAAIPMSPGVVDTPMLRQCWGDDAGHYPTPVEWASRAAPYLLSLGPADSGRSLTTP